MTDKQLDQLLPALFKAQGELEHAKKTSDNPHFKSKYADLAEVLDTAKPALQKNNLLVTHWREVDEHLNEYLITTLYHTSGQFIRSRTILLPVKKDPQGYGGAVTYARRYDLSAILGLAQDDEDGNTEKMKPTQRKKFAEEMLKQINEAPTLKDLESIWKAGQAQISDYETSLPEAYFQIITAKENRKEYLLSEEDFQKTKQLYESTPTSEGE